MMADPRYPIGRFQWAGNLSGEQREACIQKIAELPANLRAAVAGLSAQQLDTPYREGGWTVRQVVHHVPDSHLNAYTRCKLALTESEPKIRDYDEARWADLADTRDTPVEVSLALLEALHRRWVILWCGLQEQDFSRTYQHPESGVNSLQQVLAQYAWHGAHHVAHITSLRQRMGWK